MLFRAAPDHGRASAERVAALLPAGAGGWVPPEEDEQPSPSGAECSGGTDERPPAALDDAVPPRAEGDEPGGTVPRSWSDAGRHAGRDVVGPLRVLPSRSAVLGLVLVAALAAAVAAGVVLRGRPQEVAVPDVEVAGVPLPGASAAGGALGADGPGPAAPGTEVVVAVAGKVHRPGLVRLPAGSRVDDAVRAAGGPVAGASTGLLNLARRLVDGEQVLVGVAAAPGSAPAGAAQGGGLLDLNAATVADLDALPGIGPVLAQRIVDWRTENSRFASVDQLREVTGIGEAKYADLRAKVTV